MQSNKSLSKMRMASAVFVITMIVGAMAVLLASASHPIAGGIALANSSTPANPQIPPPLVPYTLVASTGAIDEASLNRYSFDGPFVRYSPASNSLDPIEIRYNVLDVSRFNPTPGYTQLELSSFTPGGSSARAILFRVDPCTGFQEPICTTLNTGSDSGICTKCQFPAAALDFSHYLYYVYVIMDRDAPAETPRVSSIRLL